MGPGFRRGSVYLWNYVVSCQEAPNAAIEQGLGLPALDQRRPEFRQLANGVNAC
jgi:hypothetical protein